MPDLRLVLFALLPVVSTTLGGMAALRFRHRLHPVMAISAGMLVATALVNLLPEAGHLLGEESELAIGAAAVVGFLGFSLLEALVHRQTYEHQHPPHQDPHEPHEHDEPHVEPSLVGIAGPAGLIVHSFLDGLAIGLGFHASPELGVIVALAVLAHDFADGINIVTLALASGRDGRFALAVVALDAVAAPIGALVSQAVSPSPLLLGLLLSSFAGVFIAIGAGHLLPEAQHRRPHSGAPLVLLAGAGAGVVLLVRAVLGG
ncbi:MAG TPA: ZIP family metal transporter [Candidatus Limnocylindrales bacterium]|nr:ZIP family metal transporter [Candidatus Limnocylindrales bacterium]